MKYHFFHNKGFSLVEAIIGIAIISLTFISAITVYSYFIKAWLNNLASIQSTYLLEEGVEIVYYLRDSGWTTKIASIPLNTTKYFKWENSNWVTSETNSFIDDIFDRSFIMNAVYRDGNGNIADSGALDSKTRKVTISNAWESSNGTTTKSISIYISDIFNN